jgi:hypothetical protein
VPVPPDVPQVVVEISPSESAPELKLALLDACTRAAQGATCVEAVADQEEIPGVIAIVSWRDAGNVRLEVALRREKEWVLRDITFDEHDVPEERWRAVGLVIGTLGTVIARGETPPPETPPAPVPPPKNAPTPVPAVPNRQTLSPSPTPRPRTHEPRGPRRGWMGAAGVLGSALVEGTQRIGADIDGAALLARFGLYGFANAAYSEGWTRPHGVRLTWVEGSLGIGGARELGARFVVVARVEGVCERFAASVSGIENASPTSDTRWLGGARLAADWMWWGLEPVGLFIGSGVGWMAGSTEVRAEGATVGIVPAFGYFLHVGAAYGFR